MAQDIDQLTRQISALIRGNTQGRNFRADVPGNAGPPSGIRQGSDRNVDLDNPPAYFDVVTMTSVFAVFPHAPRHTDAETLGITSKLDS